MGGANISNMSFKIDKNNLAEINDFQPRIGGHLGLLIDLKLGKVFSIEPGLMFITKGYKFDIPNQSDIRYKYNTFYMDIPVLAKFNWNPKEHFRVYGGLGPVFGLGLFGNLKNNGLSDAQKAYILTNHPRLPLSKEKIDFKSDIKRLDVGLMFTGGINISNFRVGIFYTQGIRSISYDHTTARNRVAGVHVGYTLQFRNEQ